MMQETKLTRRLILSGYKATQSQLNRKGGCLTAAAFKCTKSIKTLNRSICWSTIRIRGTPIHLLNVYIDTGDQELANRTLQNIEGILQSMADKRINPRIILAGDFNQLYGDFHVLASKWGLQPALS